MSNDITLYLLRAATAITSCRVSAGVADRYLHNAQVMAPLPTGGLDVLNDLESIQQQLARLEKQLDALVKGEPLPV